MKYFFRGKVVAEFKEDRWGRITTLQNEKKYTLTFPEANECQFIADDIRKLQLFFDDANDVINGAKDFKNCKDIEVY